jgi:lysozyme
MNISTPGIDLIKAFEGCKLEAYKCSGNVWTIGYGHTRHVEEGDKITQKVADYFLEYDVAMVETHCKRLINIPLEQHQWDAIVSWCFNLGCGNLRASTMLQVINSGQIDKVSEQIVRWNKAGGKVVAGLTRRRKAEAAMFDNKVDDESDE